MTKQPENSDASNPPDSLKRSWFCECGEEFYEHTAFKAHVEECDHV